MNDTRSLQGTFTSDDLMHVLQYVIGLNSPGRLELSNGRLIATLLLGEGRIYAAQCGVLQGEDVILEMIRWRAGQFVFNSGAQAQQINPQSRIQRPIQTVLLEAAVKHDTLVHETVQRADPISADSVPTVNVVGDGPIQLTSETLPVIAKIDGKSTVRDIAAALNLPMPELSRRLESLQTLGLIRLATKVTLVPAEAVETLKKTVTQLAGPMGLFAMEDAAANLGLDLRAVPIAALGPLLTAIQSEIPRERHNAYVQAVNQIIKQHKLQ